jgi:cobalt-zinc-cadmium efflux system membrane fusion protein
MKRVAVAMCTGAAVVTLAGLGLGLAWARPDLLPSWAGLGRPASAPADPGLSCTEHGVPERFCTLCHEELKTSLLLCAEHGEIPEAICTLCHPEVKEKYNIKVCT